MNSSISMRVRKLAVHSLNTMDPIQQILREFNAMFKQISERPKGNDSKDQEQSFALLSLVKHVDGIEKMMEKLAAEGGPAT
ncbi:hypothetical protein [Brevibacillus brevis]|uniref:Uncharacterized protein n=1 Tax=Brevibacillus brevis TaxID=1393 RepID=A0ABY9T5U9_BREBE|nr:hypothetical protein [Brevibacillus brevis]WNC15274.1 hypothetical protein RGB73_02545 [Brevibacillus brevis]